MGESDTVIAVSIIFGVLGTLICCFCAIRFYVMFYQRRQPSKKKQLDIQEILARQREGKRKSKRAKSKRSKSKKDSPTLSTFDTNPVYGTLGEKDEEKQSLLASPSASFEPPSSPLSPSYDDESTVDGDEELGDALDAPSDELLLRSFKEILSNGVELILHQTETKPKPCVLVLEGKVLTVRYGLFGQQQRLFLKGMRGVKAGKVTTSFNSQAGLEVPEGLCFSILSSSDSMDFECSSKMERQALYQGFKLLLDQVLESQER